MSKKDILPIKVIVMRALMKKQKGYDQMEIVSIPEPMASANLVKIKVAYAGICGTDIHTFEGTYIGNRPPVVLGHEFSGIVAEVGPDVTSVKIGDRVTSETTFETCGSCEFCLGEEYNLCSQRKGLGTEVNGGFADYVLAREKSVHILPEDVSLLAAALTEPLACCVHGAMEKTDIKRNDTAVVFGPGPIGILMSLLLLSQDVQVVLAGVTRDESRFELAKNLGISHIVNQQKQNLKQYVMGLTGGKGANKVFECSGVVAALNAGLQLAAKKAEVVQLGVFKEQFNLIDTSVFFPREIRMIGSRTQKPSSWDMSLELMRTGVVKPEKIVTNIIPLENWREGFICLRNCAEVKIVAKL